MVNLGDREVSFSCPKCGTKLTKKISWLTSNSHLPCVCGANIRLDTKELAEGVGKVEKAINDLKKSF
jgi:hypothetical protein